MSTTASEQIAGVAGLGLMGSALADTLMNQGFELRVWNRNRDKCERFANTGVRVSDSIKAIASESDLLVVCLTDHAASMEVLQSGSVAGQLAGKTLVLLSTMTAEESLITAEWADENGIDYLEGAILGYPNNVRDMSCMIVYSGPRTVFEANKPVLEAMGGMPRLVGEKAGVALRFDKAIYSTYYTHTLGLIHGAALCEAAGAPLEVFIEAMTEYWEWSSEDAYMLNRIVKRDYAVQEAPLELHAAAYAMIPPLCEQLGVSDKLPRIILAYFAAALSRGHSGNELPVLFEVLSKTEH